MVYNDTVPSSATRNYNESVVMGMLRHWRGLLRYLSQKTIKTFVLLILVISNLHGRYFRFLVCQH